MLSKNKLTKFKSAVAASSSAASSRSSSPSSSSHTPLTIAQQNNLQTIHQEHLARLASTTLPNLASLHSQRFLRLARSQVQAADSLWTAQKVQAVRYRRSLWAEDVEPVTGLGEDGGERGGKRGKGGDEMRVVPDFYHRHNPRCGRCALPLVPGLNQVTTRTGKQDRHRKGRPGKGRHSKTRKRISSCTLCHHKTRT